MLVPNGGLDVVGVEQPPFELFDGAAKPVDVQLEDVPMIGVDGKVTKQLCALVGGLDLTVHEITEEAGCVEGLEIAREDLGPFPALREKEPWSDGHLKDDR